MSRPNAPTPRTDAAWDEEWRMKAAEPNSDPAHGMCDFAMQLERELNLAQTEIKGHMRVGEELKASVRECEESLQLSIEEKELLVRNSYKAQARLAELEKEVTEATKYWCIFFEECLRVDDQLGYAQSYINKLEAMLVQVRAEWYRYTPHSQLKQDIDAALKGRA